MEVGEEQAVVPVSLTSSSFPDSSLESFEEEQEEEEKRKKGV